MESDTAAKFLNDLLHSKEYMHGKQNFRMTTTFILKNIYNTYESDIIAE